MIDSQNMNNAMQTICDKMTINSYNEVIKLINKALANIDKDKKTEIINKIKTPLLNLKKENSRIEKEFDELKMSGGSQLDNMDTYWHQIQTIMCELGSDFKQ